MPYSVQKKSFYSLSRLEKGMLVSKSHIILIFCIMQLVNQFHRARKVNSVVVVLTSVFLRVKFVMHTKIAQMVKMNPLLVVSVA